MNDEHPKHNQNGHWIHFSIYKDIQKIVIAEACAAGTKSLIQEYSTVIKKLLYGIGWVDDASKVRLFKDKGNGDKYSNSRWGVNCIQDVSASEDISNCGPFLMAVSEYEYEGNSN